MPSVLIVSQALVLQQDGLSLHPDLLLWHKQLASRKQSWFHCTDRSPLEWAGVLQGESATALLANPLASFAADICQCWTVTPYHAQLVRDHVRLYPEGLFPWSTEDATWLCGLLNPLLGEEGMSLHQTGAALLLACSVSLAANPVSFASISGKRMPNRHHEGVDGGRLNRLMSEIQMLLHQHQPETRQQRGEVAISGIWLSNPIQWPQPVKENRRTVATRNPFLQSVVDGRDAQVMISEAERFSELAKADAALPKWVVLAAEGHAVVLTKSLMPKFGKLSWQPKAIKNESALLSLLHNAL